jgi:pSer/pThr/pTyr-binding forkhead associated (FHA) protein
MARLTMRRGPASGIVYELTQDVIKIGRGTKNDIVIDHPDLSRNHCQLVRLVTDYELQDLNSTNGTFIDGQRLTGNRILQSGSLIELGDAVTFEYEIVSQPVNDITPPATQVNTSQGSPANSDKTFFLVVKLGKEADRVYLLKNDTVTIGRDLSNDIVIQDPEVSRWHLQLERSPEGYTAKDMGSTNGTLLNGVRMNVPKALTELDTLELGTSARLSYVREIRDAATSDSANAPTNDLSKSKNKPVSGPLVEQRKTTELSIDAKGDLDPTNSPRGDILNLSSKKQTSRLGTGIIQGSLVNHIFIAYMREDWEDLVAPLTVVLQDAGMSVWVDQYLAQGGADWTTAIEQALHECWLLVVIVSPESLESRYVKLEYRYFINREKPVIPFLYKPTDKMPPELSNREIIRYDKENSKRSFQRLILEILHKRSK